MSYIKEIIKVANQIEYKIAQLNLTPQELPQPVPFNIGDAVSRNLNKGFHSGPAMMQHGHTAKSPTLRPVTPTPPARVTEGVPTQVAGGPAPAAHQQTRSGQASLGQLWEAKVKQTKDKATLTQLLTQRLAEIDRQKLPAAYGNQLKEQAKALVQSITGSIASGYKAPNLTGLAPQERLQQLEQANKQRYAQPPKTPAAPAASAAPAAPAAPVKPTNDRLKQLMKERAAKEAKK